MSWRPRGQASWVSLGLSAALACGGENREQPVQIPPGPEIAQAMSAPDRLLLAAAQIALPPPGVQPGDLPDPHTPGAQAVAEFCSGCHNLPAPTIHSATDWPGVVRRMWLRMDLLPAEMRLPVPSPAQRHYMLDYLITNALQVSGAALPAGPGRETFSTVCSRCHALPDPRQHSPDDWPTVVNRMTQRMTQMSVEVAQPGQVGEILTYLQGASAPSSRR